MLGEEDNHPKYVAIGENDTMTTVADITAWLEQFAPSRLAEPWDNVGLLWAIPDAPADRVMTCLTVTPTSAAEAIRERAGLIVSHHPILFRGAKKIRADLPETGYLWKLARAGIAIASPHTAFDNTHDGINDILCRRLGLVEVAPLRPLATNPSGPRSFKVIVFTPEAEREAVSSAAFAAGAGRIGAYEECSFAIPGEGTFFGTDAANPTVGERGRRETVRELRLEFVCPARQLADVLASIRARHSYEEPAIDVYPLHDEIGTSRADRREPAGLGPMAKLALLGNSPRSSARVLGRVPWLWPATRIARFGASPSPAAPATISSRTPRWRRGRRALDRRGTVPPRARSRGPGHRFAHSRPLRNRTARRGRTGRENRVAFPAVTVWPSRDERDPLRFVGADSP